MKFIKIGLLITLIYLLFNHYLTQSKWSKSGGKSSTNSTISYSGEKPTAYKLNINFEDENHNHIYTMNNGETEINVRVEGKPIILHTRNSLKIDVNYQCFFTSASKNFDDFSMSGILNYGKNKYFIGRKSSTEVTEIVEEINKEIIEKILEQLK